MSFFKDHKGFAGILIGLALVFLATSVLAFNAMQKASKAERRAIAQYRNLESLMAIYPPPTLENQERVASELAAFRAALSQSLGVFEDATELVGSSDAVEVLPKVQGLIVDLRRSANSAGVSISEDASFGFARYREEVEPPSPEVIPLLDKQIQIVEPLISLLIASGPDSIVEVSREYVESGDPNTRDPNRPIPDAPETFIIAQEETARVAGALETLAFQMVFEGYTQSLRDFLNELSSLNLPLVVRDIQVEPAIGSQAMTQSGGATQDAGNGQAGSPFASLFGGGESERPADAEGETEGEPEQVPIIEENLSRFTVTLEYIEVTLDLEAATAALEGGEE